MTDSFKIRKGDFCVVAERLRPSEPFNTFTIGKVVKTADKNSRIVETVVPRYGTELRRQAYMAHKFWISYAIRGANNQAKAATLYGRQFSSIEAIRAEFGYSP